MIQNKSVQLLQDYSLTVKPSPFDMLENPECEYVMKTWVINNLSCNSYKLGFRDNTITNSISQPFSSPIISLLYDSKSKMTLDINFEFREFHIHSIILRFRLNKDMQQFTSAVERSIDASGYLSSPGYIGCYNKTVLLQFLNFFLDSILHCPNKPFSVLFPQRELQLGRFEYQRDFPGRWRDVRIRLFDPANRFLE